MIVIDVRGNDKGRGVYACKAFSPGHLIEICPLLFVPVTADGEPLASHVFDWSPTHEALALGYGSLYNHSYTPNAVYERDYAEKTIVFTAILPIQKGEEILVNYNGNPDDQSPVGFSVI